MMTAAGKPRFPPLETGLLLSLLLHVAAWQALTWKKNFTWGEPDALEIDLTRPFRLTTNPLLARRAVNPGVGAPVVDTPKPVSGGPAVTPPQEWVLPEPQTRERLTPPEAVPGPGGPGTESGGLGGLGERTGVGEVDWVHLTALPRMLNRGEIERNIRRFYPEPERRAGREGRVVLHLHIDREGKVTRVDVSASGGKAFDAAALKAIREARFSPAMVGEKAVPVKIPQPIDFLLEE